MARKKKQMEEQNANVATETQAGTMPVGETATMTQAPAMAKPPAAASGAAEARDGEGAADAGAEQASSPYRRLVTCPAKGFEMGENHRFRQRVFRFLEKPEPEVLARLKAAGYVYRAAEKAWTIQATPVTRVESERLAAELAGTSLELEPGGR